MTRDKAREFAKVVQAYADGKAIQSLWIGGGGWADVNPNPTFNCATYSYRIKPEPREWWIVLDCGMDGADYKYPTQEGATASAEELNRIGGFVPYTVFHVREVTT